jgi:hypothetical protein
LAYNSLFLFSVLSSLFCVFVSLSGFGMSVILASLSVFGNVPSLSISGKSLRSVGISYSLKVW